MKMPRLMVGSAAPQSDYSGQEAGGGSPESSEQYGVAAPGEGGEDILVMSYRRQPKPKPAAPKMAAKKPTAVKPAFFPVNDIIDQLSSASFGYSVPKEANIDDAVEVDMIVNPAITVDQIKDQLPDGQKVGQTIQISKVIQATVTSTDFEVTPITPERQVVMGNQNTTWKWSLKPKSVGPNKEVKITVTAIVIVDGERTERYLETYTGKVKVDITAKQRLAKWFHDNWQWVWGSLLVPVLGFIWAKFNKKKKKK